MKVEGPDGEIKDSCGNEKKKKCTRLYKGKASSKSTNSSS
jgi:hypothetical protein